MTILSYELFLELFAFSSQLELGSEQCLTLYALLNGDSNPHLSHFNIIVYILKAFIL